MQDDTGLGSTWARQAGPLIRTPDWKTPSVFLPLGARLWAVAGPRAQAGLEPRLFGCCVAEVSKAWGFCERLRLTEPDGRAPKRQVRGPDRPGGATELPVCPGEGRRAGSSTGWLSGSPSLRVVFRSFWHQSTRARSQW